MTKPRLPIAEGQVRAPLNRDRTPPYKIAGLILALAAAAGLTLTWMQFRGAFNTKAVVYVLASRAGLSMDNGSKVTYNGVPIGRLTGAEAVTAPGESSEAKLILDVDPKYLDVLPQNVDAKLLATTVFGNKYISFTSPPNPTPQRLKGGDTVNAVSVTTEFNTLFETVTAISEQVDPVKLNETLTAAAQALDGLGDKFGQSLVNGDAILTDLNQRMPTLRHDTKALADLAEVYAKASPDLWDGLKNAVTTEHTLNEQRATVDQALMAAVGFGNTGGDIFERGGPYLVRGVQDLLPTSRLLDKYSPAIDCGIRALPRAVQATAFAVGGNGYSLISHVELVGSANPYVYPDNLPRINASGGPMGRPGCWTVTRDIWPMPYMVLDTGASIAPYNHFGLGSPFASEYVWGRQDGENTINP
ncbi:MCE family protein [Mycobacterium sp. CBMA293]|uniref:MCE family protein n=1 Tax=unclassified Mycolicibacterium TaxID=2636767 RepID=UPI0012DC278C|nr:MULTISPECIES: MCE family protein [unclassified Mycolicibacterium]MUL45748.1 MCE family protein [Mycolicibacterium sp. CBMA 360]MUL60419.1 MCE family protein [Mycolicibacterium sp. CBMA 335]MUL72234.1 MCE family protein [Mycolicibacterium sp. CBMA 311]MUL95365.1 MCE family protein [Mycolicibacterium sp. CBMA 230]MUM06814.1 MCE-family protein MCE1A [Mycolicibacterium sp. CBMA 213]